MSARHGGVYQHTLLQVSPLDTPTCAASWVIYDSKLSGRAWGGLGGAWKDAGTSVSGFEIRSGAVLKNFSY